MVRLRVLVFLIICSTITVFAQDDNLNVNKEKLAVSGYDLVSYFNESVPIKGSKELNVTYHTAIYYFSSEDNKAKFKNDPEKYLPQYGGWCAYAIGAKNKKVKINPKTYKIKEDKLYLFYNSGGNNTLIKWNKDEDNLKQNADKHWSSLISKK